MLTQTVHPARIASIASAAPDIVISQSRALELIEKYYTAGPAGLKPRSLELLRQFLRHESIMTRHIAVDTPDDVPLLKDESPDRRIERFTRFAVDLGEQAGTKALSKVSLTNKDVGAIIVNTCTGYICPGLSTYLIERLGLSSSVEAYDLVGAGCGGASSRMNAAKPVTSLMPGNSELAV